MTELLNNTTAKGLLDSYFEGLSTFGYIKETMVWEFLVYFFLNDFAVRFSDMLTQNDMDLIDDLLLCLFSQKNCLMQYKTDKALSDRTQLFT